MPQNEKLLWQNRIVFSNEIKLEEKDEIISQLDASLVQKPNRVLFDMDIEAANIGYYIPRHKLAMYNFFYKRIQRDAIKRKAIQKKVANDDTVSSLIKYKVAEPPTLFSKTSVEASKNQMKDLLYNKGYFYADIKDTVLQKSNKKVVVKYLINPGKNYVIENINYDIDNIQINSLVQANKENSYIKKGRLLVLTDLSKERQRYTNLFLQNGYCNFSPSSISFVPDTVNKQLLEVLDDPFALAALTADSSFLNYNKADVNIIIREDSLQPFKTCVIKNTYVYVLKKGEVRNDANRYNERIINGIIFRYTESPVNLEIIAKNIFVKPSDLYTPQNNVATQTRLNNFGFFRNVKLYYKQLGQENEKQNYLDCYIEMSVGNKYDFGVSFDVFNTTSQNNQSGSNVTLSLQDNNLRKGVNKFNINLLGGGQANLYGLDSLNITQYNYGAKANLLMPKFLLLSKYGVSSKYSLPTTTITAGYDLNNRLNRFNIKNLNAEITYSWNESLVKTWRVKPLMVSRVDPTIIDTAFRTQVANSFFLRNLFSPYLIIGHSVSFEYNDRLNNLYKKRNNMFRLSIEESGGLATIAKNIFIKDSTTELTNYVRIETDYRNYLNSAHANWVNRIYLGLGMPYLKSLSLPISKQFSVGGSNSMRGWNFKNPIGPGAYIDTTSNNTLLSNGDIRMELNTEYRFDMVKMFSGTFMLEGATFLDVGNVWLFYEDIKRPNSGFKLGYFYKDLGINTGLGVRFDFSLMVLRVDWGIQLKKPFEAASDGWNFKDFKIFNKTWQKENSSLQIGFNYPF